MQLFRKPIVQTEAERLYDISFPLLIAPWHAGNPVDPRRTVNIRVARLNPGAQLASGDFGLINSFEKHLVGNQPPSTGEMNAFATRHDEICRLCMVKPTYDEMMEISGAHTNRTKVENDLKEIEKLFAKLPKGPEKAALKREYEALELTSKFLLPADFTAFVVHYATGQDQNDIDAMTEEMLMNCAILATRGGGDPSSKFPGRITPRVRKEFDNRAWVLFDEAQAERKRGRGKKAG